MKFVNDAQAGKKRGRGNEEAPVHKGRPKPAPAPASVKGPDPAATKASKAAREGAGPSGAAAKSGKGSMGAPPAAQEKRPGPGKQDASQPPAKSAPGCCLNPSTLPPHPQSPTQGPFSPQLFFHAIAGSVLPVMSCYFLKMHIAYLRGVQFLRG